MTTIGTPEDKTQPVPVTADTPAAPPPAKDESNLGLRNDVTIAAPAALDADDPDAIMLADAQAALEKEQGSDAAPGADGAPAAAAAPAEGAAPAATPATADTPPAGGEGGAARPAPMVPLAALQDERERRAGEAANAAYWRGVAEAHASRTPAAAAAAAAAPAKTPDQQLDEIDAQKVEIAKKLDAGTIGFGDWQTQTVALDRQARTIMAEILKPAATPTDGTKPAPANTQANDLFLEEKTAELEDVHPYTRFITQDRHWNFLRGEAVAALGAQGVQIVEGDARSTYMLRAKMAELTDVYGPQFTGRTVEQLGTKPAGAPAAGGGAGGRQPTTAAMSPIATARANKLALAAAHPANVHDLTRAGDGTAGVTDAAIEAMDDEAIAALPEATRRRFLATS